MPGRAEARGAAVAAAGACRCLYFGRSSQLRGGKTNPVRRMKELGRSCADPRPRCSPRGGHAGVYLQGSAFNAKLGESVGRVSPGRVHGSSLGAEAVLWGALL